MIDSLVWTTDAATGGAGVATVTTRSPIPIVGRILDVYLKYAGSPPSTTDVTLSTAGTQVAAVTILTITNGNTNGHFLPRKQTVGTDGAAWPTYPPEPICVADYLSAVLAQGNNGSIVTVGVMYDRGP